MYVSKLVAGAVISIALTTPVHAEKLVFLTGSQGGSWFPMGGAMKNQIERQNNELDIQVRPGASLANVVAIDSGQAQLALGSSISTVDAINGVGSFSKPVTNVCNVAKLYPFIVQSLATDLNMQTPGDFKNRDMSVNPKGNASEVTARMVLKTYGLNYEDLSKVNYASMTDQANMMKDGQVDGFIQTTTVPAGVIMDIAASRPVKLLPIPEAQVAKMKQWNAGFYDYVIPAGSYPFQKEDVHTAAFGTHVMAGCDLSEETVYGITKVLAEKMGQISVAISALKGIGAKDMAQDIGVPLHPGAARYYKEVGLL
ncbi:MAG: TAXI family TRAP transporter solute-binding subunit [Motiliproteus sp.]